MVFTGVIVPHHRDLGIWYGAPRCGQGHDLSIPDVRRFSSWRWQGKVENVLFATVSTHRMFEPWTMDSCQKKVKNQGWTVVSLGSWWSTIPIAKGQLGKLTSRWVAPLRPQPVESLSAKRAKQSSARLRPIGTPTHLGIDNPMTIRFLRRLAYERRRAHHECQESI